MHLNGHFKRFARFSAFVILGRDESPKRPKSPLSWHANGTKFVSIHTRLREAVVTKFRGCLLDHLGETWINQSSMKDR